jgi:hypothetical protein
MVSQAEVIKDLIETNWSLTGSLSKTQTANMKEVVRFFDRKQVEGNEWPKAIEVVKINNDLEENIVQFPNFYEVEDTYEITIRWRVTNVDPSTYSSALDSVEQMATELIGILDAQFNPDTSGSGYFVSGKAWRKDDHIDQAQPELKRILSMRLSQIRPNDNTVFRGNSGVVIFDTSDSVGDNKPVSDYSYTEVREVSIVEGFEQQGHLTKDKTRGRGVPHLVRGYFHGVFSFLIFAKKNDIDGTTLDKLELIYKVQGSSPLISQQAEIVLLHNVVNLESTPATFTTKSFMRINRLDKLSNDTSLVAYRVIGRLTKPSEYSMA